MFIELLHNDAQKVSHSSLVPWGQVRQPVLARKLYDAPSYVFYDAKRNGSLTLAFKREREMAVNSPFG